MSRNINVNPAHYKVAGRERQGENIVQNVERQAYAQQKAEADRWREREAPAPWETTPPAPPVTQEQRDEATAIAQVQGKKKRGASAKRSTPRRVTAKRGSSKRAGSKRTAAKRGAAKRPAPARRKSSASKSVKRRAKTRPRRRAR